MSAQLFHLSFDDKLHKLTPRVPRNFWPEHEDGYIERVCFSNSINGCLNALYASDGYKYSVYIPKHEIAVYHPTAHEVVDKDITHEVWAVDDEVAVIKVGEITVLWGDVENSILIQGIYVPVVKFVFRIDRIQGARMPNGQIQFLGDCMHGMAGQTVELPDIK